MSFFNQMGSKVCRYLLQKYLGPFLETKINLEQLNVELYKGKGTLRDVALNCESLNELCETQGWGVEVTNGNIGSVSVTVPWNALLTDNSEIEISDLSICLKPISRHTEGASMFESMWSSMSNSMQLAQEYFEKEADCNIESNAQNTNIDGLEKFAQTIEGVLCKIKAKLVNTEIRLEYLPPKSKRGIAVIIKIERLEYKNEAGDDPHENADHGLNLDEAESEHKTQLLSTYSTYHITMENITMYSEEFQISEKSSRIIDESLIASSQFYSTIEGMPETEQYLPRRTSATDAPTGIEDETEKKLEICSTERIPLIRIDGQQDIRIKMKQVENISGPKVSLEMQFGSLHTFCSPRQLHLIIKFYDIFFNDDAVMMAQNTGLSDERMVADNIKHLKYVSSNMTGGLGSQGCWAEPLEDFNTKTYLPQRKGEYCESISSSMTSSSTTTCSSKFARKSAFLDLNGDISSFSIRIASISAILLHDDVLVESSSAIGNPLSEESVAQFLEQAEYFFSNVDDVFVSQRNHLTVKFTPIIADGIQHRNNNVVQTKFSFSITRVDLAEVLEMVPIPLISFDRSENCVNGIHKRPEIAINLKSTIPSNVTAKSRKFSPTRTEINFTLEKCSLEFDISIYDRLSSVFSASPFDDNLKEPTSVDPNRTNTRDAITEVKLDAPVLEFRLRFPIADSRPIHDPNRVPWWKQNIRPDFVLISLCQFRLSFLTSLIEIVANEIDVFYCENPTSPRIHIAKSNFVNKAGIPSREPHIDYPKILIEIPSEKKLKTTLQCYSEGSDSGETSGEACNYFRSKTRTYLPFSSKRVCRESDTPHTRKDSDVSETVLEPGDTVEMKKFCDSTMKSSKLQIKVALPVASLQINSKHMYETIYNRINTDLLMWEPSAPSFKAASTPAACTSNEQSLFNIGLMDSMYVPTPSTLNSEVADDIFGSRINYTSDGCASGTTSDCESESMYYSTYERKRSKRSQSAVTLSPSACSFELIINEGMLTVYSSIRDVEHRVLPGQMGEFTIKLDQLSLFSVSGFHGNINLAYLCLQTRSIEIFHCGQLSVPLGSIQPLRLLTSQIPSHSEATLYSTPNGLTKSEYPDSHSKREMIALAIEIKKVPEQRVKRIRLTAGVKKATLKHNLCQPQYTWLNQLIDFVDVLDYPIEGYKPFGIVTEMQLHLWDCAVDYRPKQFNHRALLEIGTFMMSSNLISSTTGCTLRFVAEDCVLSLAPYDSSNHKTPDNTITALPSSQLVPVLDMGLVDISLRLNEKATENFPKLDLRASIQDVHIRTCSDSGRALAQLIAYFACECEAANSRDDNESMTSSHSSSIYSDADLLQVRGRRTSAPEITAKQQERVNLLMAEAVQETVRSSKPIDSSGDNEFRCDRGVEVFFFPDESHQLKKDQQLPETEMDRDDDSPLRETSPKTPNSLRCRSGSEEWSFKPRRESESSNELRDLLNFEANVMEQSYMVDEEIATEALPQIREDLGEVPRKITPPRRSSIGLDDDFYIVADEEKAFIQSHCGIKNVRISDDPLRIVDNHFTLPNGKPDLLKAPENFPMAVMRYTLCEMTLTWHMYGGTDFHSDNNDNKASNEKENIRPLTSARRTLMSDAYKHGVSYSKSQNNLQFGKKPMEKMSWKTRGGRDRNHDVLIEIQLTKVRLTHEIYPVQTTQASRQVLVISELEIRDRLQSSQINKLLYHPSAKHLPNKSSQHMIVVKAFHVRPNPHCNNTQECSLRVSLLPLRLNIDQDALLFIVQFFNDLKEEVSLTNVSDDSPERRTSYTSQPPVMMVDEIPEAVQDLQARRMVSTNLDLLMDDDHHGKKVGANNESQTVSTSTTDTDGPVYFREVVFSPEVLIRLDYHGRRIEMSRGPVAGLLMGLGQLQCSEIRLKRIIHKRGVLGLDKLFSHLLNEWLDDIKKKQLPAILRGVGPTQTVLQLFQGIWDLFWLPIEQYQKDGRIVRGLQLGAQSFTARTALAALEITSRIIHLLQLTAETAFDMVSPGPSVRQRRHHRKGKRKRPHRPQDIREGVANAYQIVKEGINETASNIYETTIIEHDQKGYTGAVGAVFRQIPPLAVGPLVLATQATTNILEGVKSQLVPDSKIEAREKWKDDSD